MCTPNLHNQRNISKKPLSSPPCDLCYPVSVDLTVFPTGECGLDYEHNNDTTVPPNELFALQQKWFERQLQLAVELQKPVFLHERAAQGPFLEMLAKYRKVEVVVSFCVIDVVFCFPGSACSYNQLLYWNRARID